MAEEEAEEEGEDRPDRLWKGFMQLIFVKIKPPPVSFSFSVKAEALVP